MSIAAGKKDRDRRQEAEQRRERRAETGSGAEAGSWDRNTRAGGRTKKKRNENAAERGNRE